MTFDSRRRLCAYADDQVVAIAHSIPFGQWLGGRQLPCAGIGAVAVLPEYRGQGAARALVSELLAQERAEGMAVSALYPANAELYRQLGYEYAGLHPGFRAPVADIPPSRGEVAEMGGTDLDGVIACFSRFAAAHNGPVQPLDRACWQTDVLAHPGEGTHQRTVVVPVRQVTSPVTPVTSSKMLALMATGWLASTWSRSRRSPSPPCLVISAASRTPPPRSLGSGRLPGALWGWPSAPAPSPCSPTLNRWMGRILDVPRALEGRGYPDVSGDLVIELSDPLFPGNTGPWLVRATGGQVSRHARARSVTVPGPTVPIGLFSALYTGFATVGDLVLRGALDESDRDCPFCPPFSAAPSPGCPTSSNQSFPPLAALA